MKNNNLLKFLFILVFAFFLPLQSYALDFSTVLCNAYSVFNGQWGKIFALFALVALAISFFLGKISWGTVLSVAMGVALIFGGNAIVNLLVGGSGSICTTTGSTA
jgi:type IV secretory pathway VirB2 component (pilin)